MTDTFTGQAVGELLRLREDAAVLASPDRGTGIAVRYFAQWLGVLSPAQQETLAVLGSAWTSEAGILRAARARGGEDAVGDSSRLLAGLRRGGWLAQQVVCDGRTILSVRPTAVDAWVRREPTAPGSLLVLSRFTVLRGQDRGLRIESPCACCVVDVPDREAAAVLGSLAVPRPEAELLGTDAAPWLGRVLSMLLEHGFVVTAGTEDADLRSSQWSAHELWFHSRSRLGRHDLPYGGTYWAGTPHVRIKNDSRHFRCTYQGKTRHTHDRRPDQNCNIRSSRPID